MAAAPAPSLVVSLATAAQRVISALNSAPEIRAAIVAFWEKDGKPALNKFVGQETALMLGAVPFVGGFLRGFSGVFAGGIDSGADLTFEDVVAIVVADPSQPATPQSPPI